jgi:hypothetical protein
MELLGVCAAIVLAATAPTIVTAFIFMETRPLAFGVRVVVSCSEHWTTDAIHGPRGMIMSSSSWLHQQGGKVRST